MRHNIIIIIKTIMAIDYRWNQYTIGVCCADKSTPDKDYYLVWKLWFKWR